MQAASLVLVTAPPWLQRPQMVSVVPIASWPHTRASHLGRALAVSS